MSPVRKKVLAISGLCGCELCLPSKVSTVHEGGSEPELKIERLLVSTRIWIGFPEL